VETPSEPVKSVQSKNSKAEDKRAARKARASEGKGIEKEQAKRGAKRKRTQPSNNTDGIGGKGEAWTEGAAAMATSTKPDDWEDPNGWWTIDMSAWETLNLHPLLQRNLALAGFKKPTPIQDAALPPAMLHRKDVIGTAETGSGKTLAYALPIVQRLLIARARKGLGICRPDAPFAELVKENDAQYGGGNMNTLVGAIGDAKEFAGVLQGLAASDTGAGDEPMLEAAPAVDMKRGVITEHPRFWDGLPALMLCPTRELALQVRDHVARLVAGTFVKCVAIVGGLSQAKHARMLRQRPDIVVATPGRFWDMVRSGKHDHLRDLKSSLRFLVLDEADRLVEPGHFSDLAEFLHAIHPDTTRTHTSDELLDGGGEGSGDEEGGATAVMPPSSTHNPEKHLPVPFGGRLERQTFLFSATLAATGKGVAGAAAAQRSAVQRNSAELVLAQLRSAHLSLV
jgi:ATP-dependent RNA helicase DDX24/MAK5